MSFLVALQIYSVRDDAEKDLFGTLKKVKEIGYDGVEFAGLYGHDPSEVKKMCEDVGLIPISAHVPLWDMKDDSNLLESYKKIGCDYVAIPSLAMGYRPGQDKFFETIADINMFTEKAKETGIKLCYHNHDFEFIKMDEKYGLDVLYDQVPTLMAELDCCWIRVAGEKPEEYIRKYADREEILHLKDYVGDKSQNMYELIGIDEGKKKNDGPFEFRPIGYGLLDVPNVIKAARECGIEWLIVEQDRPSMGKTPLECAKMSFEYLKNILRVQ